MSTSQETTYNEHGDDEAFFVDVPVPEEKRPRGRPRKDAPAPIANPMTRIDQSEGASLADWLTGIGDGAAVKIKIMRQPTLWKGAKIGGVVGVFHDSAVVDESYLLENFGGGKYTIHVMRGGKFFGQRTIELEGDPKPANTIDDEPTGLGAAEASMFGMLKEFTAGDRARAERQEDLIMGLLAKNNDAGPMTAVVEMMKAQIAAGQAQLAAANAKANEPNGTERMMERYIMTDAERLARMRDAHETEIRTVRESHRDDLKRGEATAALQLEGLKQAWSREVDNLRTAHLITIESIKISHVAQFSLLENSAKFFEREVERLRVENTELRSRKETTITDQITTMAATMEAMDTLRGKNNDPAEDSMIDKGLKIMEGLSQTPVVRAVAHRIANPHPSPNPTPPPSRREPSTAPQAQSLLPVEEGVPALDVDQETIKQALAFLEAAAANGTDPAAFAASVVSMVPSSILGYVREHGVNTFLKAAGAVSGSPLTQMSGKNWLKDVVKALGSS